MVLTPDAAIRRDDRRRTRRKPLLCLRAATLFFSLPPCTRALVCALPRLEGTFVHTRLGGDSPPIRRPAGGIMPTRGPRVQER